MFYLKRLILTTQSNGKSMLDFEPGLNIIYGPSRVGKSLVVDFIDYMFGGSSEKITENPIGFKSAALVIDVDGHAVTLTREVGSNDIDVSGTVDGIENGIYKATNAKQSIYQFWLKLMGIEGEVKIASKQDTSPQKLGIRTFMHFFLIEEERMSGKDSILKNPEVFRSNVPVPTIMSIIYLAVGKTYTDGKKVLTPAAKQAADKAVDSLIDKSLDKLRTQKYEAMIIPENEIDPDELEREIEATKQEIREAEEKVDRLTHESIQLSREILKLNDNIHETSVLRSRYNDLMSQYESDIRRLTFIAEGDLHKDIVPKIERCPFCNGELSKEKEESCVDAAIAEVEKIHMQIQDLTSAQKDLDEEIEQLSDERNKKEARRVEIREQINEELNPRLSNLTNILNGYRVAIGRQKVAEIIEQFSDTIISEGKEVKEDNAIPEKIDINQVVDDVITEPLERWLKTILEDADYDPFDEVSYDHKKCDVKIDNISKAVQGQGYCAYLNSVMAIALQKVLIEYDLYAPRFMVLDSPILSLSEKLNKGEKSASSRMKKGLFNYLDKECSDFQSIVIENEIPDIKYENAKLIEFTQDDHIGRYGLIETYRMNK